MSIETFARSHRLKVREDCDGTKIIRGKTGQIYEHDPNAQQPLAVMVMPNPPRSHFWGFAREQLLAAGCTIIQNGDGEGAATFDPGAASQVKLAIKAAGVKKRKKASPAQLEALRKSNEARIQG